MKTKGLLLLLTTIVLCSCTQQTMYHWHKPSTGTTQFVKDHNTCLCSANFFPFTSPQLLQSTQLNNTRLKQNRSNGIWASWVPYKGAQPLYVNSAMNDSTMLRPLYASCMERRGYRQAYTRTKSKDVGSLRCDTVTCQSGYEDYNYEDDGFLE